MRDDHRFCEACWNRAEKATTEVSIEGTLEI